MRFARSLIVLTCITGPADAQHPVVPLVLNHLAIVLDSATYHDVRESPLMREQFAAIDSTRRSLRNSIAGTYWFGKYNYLSLAAPHDQVRVGDVMIALGTEATNGLETLEKWGGFVHAWAIAGNAGPSLHDAWSYVDALLPAVPDSMAGHVQFVLERYSTSLARQLAVLDSQPPTKLANSRFLAPRFDKMRLLEYLSGATLAIPVDDIAKIVKVLRRDSVTVYDEGEGAIIKLSGFTLHLIPPWTGAGVKQLQFALTHDVVANPIYTFGPHSRLRFGPGPIAVWDFDTK